MRSAGGEMTNKSKKKKAPTVGLEPTTDRLTADCSTIELCRIEQTSYYVYLGVIVKVNAKKFF